MDVRGFLDDVRASGRGDRVVHVRKIPARAARFADPARALAAPLRRWLDARGIARLWAHQAQAVDLLDQGRDVLVATGPASGKSLCHLLPILEALAADADSRALLVDPTKALSQDQCRAFLAAASTAGLGEIVAGIYDGFTPGPARRRLRDRARVLFTNPDMLHAALLPEHARLAGFLAHTRFLVLDESTSSTESSA